MVDGAQQRTKTNCKRAPEWIRRPENCNLLLLQHIDWKFMQIPWIVRNQSISLCRFSVVHLYFWLFLYFHFLENNLICYQQSMKRIHLFKLKYSCLAIHVCILQLTSILHCIMKRKWCILLQVPQLNCATRSMC